MKRPGVRISKSARPGKKLVAVFSYADGRTKTVHFGCATCGDFVARGLFSLTDFSL